MTGQLLDPVKAQQVYLNQGIGGAPSQREEDLFIRECLQWLSKWLSHHGDSAKGSDTFCAFLCSPTQPVGSLISGSSFNRAFKASFDSRLASRIFECTANLERVHSAPLTQGSISDFLSHFEMLPASSSTVLVIFLPAQSAVLILPPGADLNAPVRLDLPKLESAAPFKFSELENLLEQFFDVFLSTNNARLKLWRTANKREMRSNPEELVQHILIAWLDLRIGRGNTLIRYEVQNRRGREDIEVITSTGQAFEFGLIELKVLKPQESEKKNLEWALSGIKQLKDYRSTISHKVPISLLACYDGRKKDAPMPEIQKEATDADILARRYFMETPSCKRCTTFNT